MESALSGLVGVNACGLKGSETKTDKKTQAEPQGKRVGFRLAGYVFTYRRASQQAQVKIEMWRENPETAERYWVTVAACAPNSQSARSVALALVAWVRSLDVSERKDIQSQAVAESFAILQARLSQSEPKASGSVRTRKLVRAATQRDVSGGTHVVAA